MYKSNVILKRAHRLFVCKNYSVSLSTNVWTPENIVRSPYNDIIIPNILLSDHIWKNLDRWSDKIATICGITNRHYTYHQLYKYSRNFASNLRTKLQIRDHDVVCIMMHNSPEYPIAALGSLQAGAVVTTVNPIYTLYEFEKQLSLSNPKVIIGSPETVQIIKEACKLAEKEIPIIIVNNNKTPQGTIAFHEFAEDIHADHSILKEVKVKADDVALLPYSSGTTGLSKGVELTNTNIVFNCMQQDVKGVKQYNDTTSSHQDELVGVLPFYHIYGLSVIMFHKLSVGNKLVTLPKFQPNTFLKALKNTSLLYAAPPIMLFLGSHPDVKEEHLASVRKIFSAAAPLPKKDIDVVLSKVKHNVDFIQMYGLTETSPMVTSMPPGSDKYSSAGVAVSNTQLKVVDFNGKTLGANEVGELYVKGPQVMKGYRNNPEATKNTITRDGWCKTGDLVYIDEHGYITVVDRIKELIKVKGFQVPPAELENVLKEHPDILDVAVLGIADKKTGEAPRAFVVLKEGRNVKPDAIKDFVARKVAEYKRIKEVVFLNELPKNPSGKILKRVLKEQFP